MSNLNDIKESINIINAMKETHLNWAEYFEDNPDIEKEYIATGNWDSAEKHRKIIKQYDKILSVLESL